MAKASNQTYENIDRPYGDHLEREGDRNINVDVEPTTTSGAGTSAPGGFGAESKTPVKSEQSFNNIWIDKKIRSKNWKPRKFGFLIDGETGYAEFSNVYITGIITVEAGGTVGGWTVGANDLHSGNVYINSANEQILMGGATNPLTGLGIFMGKDGSDYEFRAGDPSGEYMHWDGSNLDIKGALTATSIDVPDTVTDASFHVASDGDTWWGDATQADAIASITKDGEAFFQDLIVMERKQATIFEDLNRFSTSVTGSGAVTLGNTGVFVNTAGTSGSSAKIKWVNASYELAEPGTVVSFNLQYSVWNVDHEGFFGIGNPTVAGTGITFTDDHIGFKVVNSGGVSRMYATQASGASETVSGILSTISSGNSYDLLIRITSATTVEYWMNVNANGWNKMATLSTNKPTGEADLIWALSNNSTAATSNLTLRSAAATY